MRLLNEAIEDCLSLAPQRRLEHRLLSDCDQFYLSEDLYALSPQPRWSQSAMDGYAVRAADANAQSILKLGELIAAGQWPQHPLKHGEAARIFTGAPIPSGADAVVIQENTKCGHTVDQIKLTKTAQVGDHIRRQGEEYQVGDLLAQQYDKVTPGLLGLCASQGLSQLPVFSRPKVALIETGTELKSLGESLEAAQIYASNAITLAPMIKSSCGDVINITKVDDHVQEVVEQIQNSIQLGAQLIITTGGVSVGDFDPIHKALQIMGAERVFWKVRMKPGKPLSVATVSSQHQKCILIGLPGNPVSCVVGYLLFVHPLLQHLAGQRKEQLGLRRIHCTLMHDLDKSHQRAELFRVKLTPSSNGSHYPSRYICSLTGTQSSAWISSIMKADGLLYAPNEPIHWKAGDQVEVALLPWSQIYPSAYLF